MALVGLAAVLAGCAVFGFGGAAAPVHTQSFRSESAAPLPNGVDPMAALLQRPMRPPSLPRDETCTASTSGDLGAVAPNYGAGVGPAYLSGQALASSSVSDNANAADKERQHGVNVVPAVQTTGGGLYLGPVAPTSFWRAWFGDLATDGAGCFGLQVDGDVFTEFIVFDVNPGSPPPG